MKKFLLPSSLVILLALLFLPACGKHNKNEKGNIGTGQSKDTTPPGEVKNLTIISGDSQLTLKWENPSDEDLRGILILRKEDTYPSKNTSDGTKVFTGKAEEFTDTGLLNDKPYYYRVFTYDQNFNFSKGVNISGVPQHQIKPSDLPDVTNLKIYTGNELSNLIVQWQKPSDEYQYRVLLNNYGITFVAGNSSQYTINHVLIETGVPVTVAVQTCTSDYNTCNNGVHSTIILPTISTPSNIFETPLPPSNISADIKMLIKSTDGGIIYNNASQLKYLNFYSTSPKEFLSLGGGAEDFVLGAAEVTAAGNKYFYTLLLDSDGNQSYINIVKSVVDSSGEVNYSRGVIQDNITASSFCGNFIKESVSPLGAEFIYATDNQIHLGTVSSNHYFSTSSLFSVSTTKSIENCYYVTQQHDYLTGDLAAFEKDENGIYGLTIYKLSGMDYSTEASYVAGTDTSSAMLKGGNIITDDTYHFFTLTYHDDANSLCKAYLIYKKNPSQAQWDELDLSTLNPFITNSDGVSSDVYIFPDKKSGYMTVFTTTTESGSWGNSTRYYYAYFVSFTIENQKLKINPTRLEEIASFRGLIPALLFDITVLDPSYLVGVKFTPWPFSMKVYSMTYNGSRWNRRVITNYNSYNIVREGEDGIYSSSPGSVFTFTPQGDPATVVSSISNPDFDGAEFNGTDRIISITNGNNDISIDNTSIYSGSSTISYVTVPFYSPGVSIITFKDANGIQMLKYESGNWNNYFIAGNSGSPLCNTSVYDFYPLSITLQNIFNIFFLDGNGNLNSAEWVNGYPYGCTTYSVNITGSPDTMEILPVDDSSILFAVSEHTGSGDIGNGDSVFTEYFYLNTVDNSITDHNLIPEYATMGSPLKVSWNNSKVLAILYYNPAEKAIKLFYPGTGDVSYVATTDLTGTGNSYVARRPMVYLDTMLNLFRVSFSNINGRIITLNIP